MVLLNVLGGVHPRLILLAYAGIASTALFVLAIAICVSSGASDGRRAVQCHGSLDHRLAHRSRSSWE